LVAAKLRELGIDEVEMVGATEEHPNLIASVCSRSGGSTLILSGHLDTKPPGDLSAWRRDPYSPVIEHGELYGLGSGDMKVALAAMVYAAAAVRAASAQGSLMLVFTADEEAGSVHGSQWLAESGRLQADAAVIGEPCGIVREWESIDILLGPDLHRLASMSFVASVVAFILATPSTLVAPPGVSVHHA
jgi:acetylornithine deacetylase/succinyl-diaminopimelate desuccinylase-like protein